MNRRSLLNITSRKKRNTMINYANTSTEDGGSVTIGPGPLLVSGTTGAACLFSPTAMDLYDSTGQQGDVAEVATRTATTCYMRGFSEKIRIQTSSGRPWFWRRIVFKAKRPTIYNSFQPGDTPIQTNDGNPSFIDTNNGMERLYFNLVINNSASTISAIYSQLFKGQSGKDWRDVLSAPVDTARVDLMSDTSRTITSGNQVGTVRDYNVFYPMNKNIVYDDDENGDTESTTYTSVQDKQGMGDCYILDLFYPGTGAVATDLLQLESTSTLYWHEK